MQVVRGLECVAVLAGNSEVQVVRLPLRKVMVERGPASGASNATTAVSAKNAPMPLNIALNLIHEIIA